MKFGFLTASFLIASLGFGQLSGSYTINVLLPTTASNFNSFEDFTTIIESGGVSGPVDVEVYEDWYTGVVMNLNTIAGLSSTNTLTIWGQTGNPDDIVIYENDISILNQNYITFEDVTFNLNGGSIDIDNCDYITFDNCDFDDLINGITLDITNSDFLTVTNSEFNGGNISLQLNNVEETYISNNEFYESVQAIRCWNGNTTQYIADNYFETSKTDAAYQIFVINTLNLPIGADSVVIKNNEIKMAFADVGLLVSVGSTHPANLSYIYNNSIYVGGISTSPFAEGCGLLYGGNNMSIHHNSIHVENTTGAEGCAVKCDMLTNDISAVSIKNNIFSTNGLGPAALFIDDPDMVDMDNNNYYTAGTNLVYTASAFVPDLSTFQGLTSGDASSLETDPMFINTTNYTSADLRTCSEDLDGAGVVDPLISLDINSDSRDMVNADIGAFNIEPAPTVMTIDNLPDSLCKTDAPITLAGTPAGGSFSGPGVSGGVIDPDAPAVGMHDITYTITTGSGCSNFVEQVVTIVDCSVGINSSNLDAIRLYPNPTVDIVYLDGISQEDVITVYSRSGSLILTQPGNSDVTNSVNLSSLNPGFYLLHVAGPDRETIKLSVVIQ